MNEWEGSRRSCFGLIFDLRPLWTTNQGQRGPESGNRKSNPGSAIHWPQELAFLRSKSFLNKANRNLWAWSCSWLFQSQKKEMTEVHYWNWDCYYSASSFIYKEFPKTLLVFRSKYSLGWILPFEIVTIWFSAINC